MRALLREPLVHFLLGGALLFLLHGVAAEPGAGRPDRIVVDEDRVARLVGSFERTWLRPPTASELRNLVDDYVTEEVLYREALAFGLDRDDLVVRRRMRQKMEFLHDGIAESEPGEEALRAFLAENPERFRVAPRVSFLQIFLDPERGPVEERADALLPRLRGGASPDAIGDPTLLPPAMENATRDSVAGVFGPELAEALLETPEDAWTGPLDSRFGAHLVRVTVRRPGRVPALHQVRGAVLREWESEQRSRERERFYEAMRSRYEIVVRMPEGGAAPEVADGS